MSRRLISMRLAGMRTSLWTGVTSRARAVGRLALSSRGQTLIEFVLVAPLMFLFLFSIVDFGIAIDRRLALQHAVREGARYAAVHTDEAAIKQRTVDQAQDMIVVGDVDVCYVDLDADATYGEPGDGVRVQASLTWDFPILGEIFDAFGASAPSIEMTPSGTARLERSVTGAVPCT